MADESRTIIVDVETDIDVQLGDVNKEIDKNRKQLKELKKDYSANATEISKLERKNQDLSKTKRELIKDYNAEKGSLNQLRRTLRQQVQERNSLNISTEEGKKKFDEMNVSIKALNEEISGFEQAGGDFRRNVGNYPEMLDAANTATGGFISSLTGLLNPLAAVAAGAGALFAAYAKTGRGSADLARAQDRLAAGLNDVGNGIADLVGKRGFIDEFLRGLQKQFFGIASTIRSDVIVSVKEFLREFELVQLRSDELAKRRLQDAEKQRQIRDEERNSLKDRIAANNLLLKIINQREREQIAAQEKRIKNLRFELNLNKEDLELQKQLQQAQFELADIQEEAEGFRSEALVNDLALAREGAAQRSELRKLQLEEELLAVQEGSRREFEIRQQIINDTLAIELEAVGENMLARQILEQEAKNNLLILEQEFIDEKLALIDKEAQAREKAAKKTEKVTKKAKKTEAKDTVDLAALEKKVRQDGFNALVSLAGQGSTIGRIAAVGSIIRSSAEGIAGAVAAAQSVPWPGNLAAAASGIAQVVAVIAQANSILSSDPSQSIGGGGVGAPSVRASASAPSGLANVNAGLLSQFSTGPESTAAQTDGFNQTVSNLPAPQVSVVDINNAQAERNVKVTEASLG